MNRDAIHILLVDDSTPATDRFQQAFTEQSGQVEIIVVSTLAEAKSCLNWAMVDLIICEAVLPDGKGVELIATTQAADGFPCVVLTERGDEQMAVEALRAGALNYWVKSDTVLAALPQLVQETIDEWSARKEAGGNGTARFGEKKFRTFFESAAAGMVTISTEGYFLAMNEAFCSFVGYSVAELSRLRVADITHPEDLEQTEELYRLLGSGQLRSSNYQKRFLRKDGEQVWGHVSVAVVPSKDGQSQYYVGLVQDITESKRIQDQVRESQQMLQLVLDYIPQFVFWKDRNSVFLGCNRNFARAAGANSSDELIGKTDYELPWTREEAEFYRECDRRVMEADAPELHIIETQLQADGKQAWLDTNKIPLHDSEGNVVGILGTFEDITTRKQAQDQLIETNRELDAFVYTVSHDLRSPLTPIIGYAEELQESYRDRLDAKALDWLGRIEKQGRRMLSVMEDLLLLAKVGQVAPPAEPVDMNLVLEDVLVGRAGQLTQLGITIDSEPLPSVRITKTFLPQILDNLISNALNYAGRDGGPIKVGAETRGKQVRFFVQDHGPGVAPQERAQIFELFNRGSKERDFSGTGVGLAIVKKIARIYSGRTWVEETPGGGSTFWVEMVSE